VVSFGRRLPFGNVAKVLVALFAPFTVTEEEPVAIPIENGA
jgi:hypothetical protein